MLPFYFLMLRSAVLRQGRAVFHFCYRSLEVLVEHKPYSIFSISCNLFGFVSFVRLVRFMVVFAFASFAGVVVHADTSPLEVSAGSDFNSSEYASFSLKGSVSEGTGTLPYSYSWSVTASTCLDYKARRDREGFIACSTLTSGLASSGVDLDTIDATFTAPGLTANVTAVPITFRFTVTDANNYQVSDTVTVTFGLDVTSPTVSISYIPSLTNDGAFDVQFLFSEIVTDFDEADITLLDGVKGTFSGVGRSYTLAITPASAGVAPIVSVAAGVASDQKGNPNTASAALQIMLNARPTADAGADQTVISGDIVTLDGAGSSDPDAGDTLTYVWTQTEGAAVTLSDATAVSPTFTAPILGANDTAETLSFSLVVTDDKSNISAADSVVITLGPEASIAASELEKFEQEVRATVQDQAVRDLQSTLAANQKSVREARGRLISQLTAMDDKQNETAEIPFDLNGMLEASGTTISTKGTFFGAQSVGTGAQRLLFGDFDLQRDGETGSSTATMTGRMAWEQMISERTLLGYFVGGELAQSNIAGAFDGNQNRVAMTVGGYAVHELAKNTYVDGFVTLGAGRNNLEMANEVLALESDYTTRSVTFGGALSSVIEQSGYEIWPEISFSYGRTWIGDVGFTGRAYGLVDNMLSLDAGSVTLANIMFRPEFRVPLDGLASTESLQLFTFAPRLICEQIKATSTQGSCGGGAEIGITGKSSDGRSTYSANIAADELGNRSNSMVQLKLEHRF